MIKKLAHLLASAAVAVAALVTPLAGLSRAAGDNLIANPSVETAASPTQPTGWLTGGWGTHTTTYAYDTAGAQDGTRALSLTISGYASGDAKWYFNPVAVTAGTAYTFSDYYQATAPSQIDAQVQDSAGNLSYLWLADLPAAGSWTPVSVNFTAPAGAAKVTVFHLLATSGTLRTDNFSLAPVMTSTPSPSPAPSATPAPTPTPAPAGNTVPNAGLETAAGSVPASWTNGAWGTNTSSFTYLSSGHTGTRSVKVNVSAYTTGAANWSYAPQAVAPGGHYRFTDWYLSGATTEIDAPVTMADGTTQYYYLTKVLPATAWTQAQAEFDMPAGAVSATVFHLIAAKGYLTTDDYSFGLYTPAPFSRGLVSLTFDDGWADQYTGAFPLLRKYGLTGTFYIISGELYDQPDYMTVAQIAALKAAGNEVASHTVSHPDLTTLSSTKLTAELKNSQTTLASKFGGPILDFATPYGAYNAKVLAAIQTYYRSHRSTDTGFNTKDNFNVYNLRVQNIYSTTTPAQVQAWAGQAVAQHTWLILVYHEVAVTPVDPTDATYDTQPADLDAELAAIKASGAGVVTIGQGIAEVQPQL